MKCPKCGVPLVPSDRQGVEVDRCPDCRGVWLDRGELDKIVDRSAAFEDTGRYPFEADGDPDRRGDGGDDRDARYRPHRDADRNRPYPKRKSFWQELFD